MNADVETCLGCGADCRAQDLHAATCSECGGVCQACEGCAAASVELMCAACVDALLPLFVEYLRRRLALAAMLN